MKKLFCMSFIIVLFDNSLNMNKLSGDGTCFDDRIILMFILIY